MGLTWQFQKLLRRIHCQYFGIFIAQVQAGQATHVLEAGVEPTSPCRSGWVGHSKPDRELIRSAIGRRIVVIAREAGP
jgi:hypothetical protein